MIQCLKCNRVWPTGTVWCGICKATLGVKLCPDGHVNQPVCSCCSTCGKCPLSLCVPCRRLMPTLRVFAVFLLLLVAPFIIPLLTLCASLLARNLVRPLESIVLHLLALFLLVRAFGGNRGCQLVKSIWRRLLALAQATAKWIRALI